MGRCLPMSARDPHGAASPHDPPGALCAHGRIAERSGAETTKQTERFVVLPMGWK